MARSTRRMRWAAVLAALGLALAGCGGEQTGAKPADSASPTSTTSTSAPAGTSGAALFSALTTAMTEKGSATVDLSVTTGGQTITGNGVYQLGGSEGIGADLTMTMPGQGEMRMILLGQDVFLNMPQLQAQTGKPWIKITAGGTDPLSASLGQITDQLRGGLDPSEGLAIIQGATTVQQTGEETLDGVQTTVYAVTLDLKKAAEYAQGSLKQQYEQLAASGVQTLDFTLWVDGEDLLRKFRTVVPTPQGDVEAVGTYSGWGEPVQIEAPPANQVATPPTSP